MLPAYRAPFFDRLAEACQDGLSVFAGAARSEEAIQSTDRLDVAHYVKARNLHLFGDPFYLCLQLGLVKWLQDWDPEILILEANPRYLVNRTAIRWMKHRSRSVIGWGLGAPTIRGPMASLRRLVRENALPRFDLLIAYSSLGAEQYRALGVPKNRVLVAPNAVSPPPSPLPERAPLVNRPARLLFVGRLQERKRVDLLLRACAQLETAPDVWIVGDGPARVKVEQLAREIYPRANFAGSQHGHALDWFFDKADLFVLPGTGGLAVQQAMAHGLPVIVAEGDGTQNDLVAGDNGWLIPSADLDALTETLRNALSNPKRLQEMGGRSHQLVSERYNINTMVDVFVQAMNTCKEKTPLEK
ncbi:MAG: glycosyltransferase family 4 protein [Anaerolineaceae bacterium]|nr:MAG: glycosyltransferase family 4 protein [Anaerolineaceae bacterium]